MDRKYDVLKLENQLCFPLYAAAKEVVHRYKPYLDELDLTYTQYIAMMVMWEKEEVTVKELGQMLYLDSGTLTPVLKKLEAKGYVTRARSQKDERNLCVSITEKGRSLKDQAVEIPLKLAKCLPLEEGDVLELYQILHKILGQLACQK